MPLKAKGQKVDASTEDQSQYEQTPAGYQSLWTEEFKTADRELRIWHKQASEVEKVYQDDRKDIATEQEKRTNLYTVNTINEEALLYGRPPRTDVTRKYEDANDDVARVAGTMMERILNGDIDRPNDRFARACGYALSDFERTNFGLLRFRYEVEHRQVAAQPAVKRPHPVTRKMVEVVPAVDAHEEKTWEDVPTDYVHWRDVKWSPCRIWEEARWIAFRVQMTRTELRKRFKKEGDKVQLNSKKVDKDDADTPDDQPRFPWGRADVWEIWSKEHKRLFWFVEGHKRILDVVDDPWELEDFWPCPRMLIAWITTTRLLPKPEYLIAQDSYKSIDGLTTRIDLLVSALRVVGIYDENFKDLQTLLDNTEDNVMIPVPNWNSVVSDKGGLEGVVSWFPLEQVVNVLEQLRTQRAQEIELNRQLTGQADLMRGALENPGETATATREKLKFASKRVQRKQDMFAEFVSDAQRIRAEIILKLFDDDTIRARSNIDNTEDAQFADEALKLLREQGIEGYRITVKSEALSLPDFAEMKAERTEFMGAMANVVGSMVKLPPSALVILPELATALKWYAAGFRGATEIESAMGRMVKKLQQMANQPPQGQQGPDPKVQAQQLKNQGDQQRIELESKARAQEIQEETQAEIIKQKAQAEFNAEEERAKDLHHHAAESAATEHQEAAAHARELERGAAEHAREVVREHLAHQRQLELERLKGEQAMKVAKAKPKPKPGGKK